MVGSPKAKVLGQGMMFGSGAGIMAEDEGVEKRLSCVSPWEPACGDSQAMPQPIF